MAEEPWEDPRHAPPEERYELTVLLVGFNGLPVDGTVAQTFVGGVENASFRQIVEADLARLARSMPALEDLRISSWWSLVNGGGVSWREPESFGILKRVRRALEALPYIDHVDFSPVIVDFETAGIETIGTLEPRSKPEPGACPRTRPGRRRIDLRPPEVILHLFTPPGMPPGGFMISADARDECGVSTVQASLEGDVTGIRTRRPYDFSFQVAGFPVEVCALATDTSGNSRAACAFVASQPPPEGCLDSGQCAPGEYCAKAPGDCDGVGRCLSQPGACLDFYDPVCGCDGTTYSNAGCAAVAGVNVAYKGECL